MTGSFSKRRLSRRGLLVGAGALAAAARPTAAHAARDVIWSSSIAGTPNLARFASRRKPLLVSRFPGLRVLPWVPLVDGPTPIERLDRLEAATGLGNLWIKRDDLTHAEYGGNKVRKHEFLLADALALNRNHLVTVGGIGSHHCCSTACFGRQLGLTTTMVHAPQPVTVHVREMLRWDAFYGARFRLAANPVAQAWATWDELDAARDRGLRPHFIWAGGSTPYGTLGYFNAGLEFGAQIEAGEAPVPAAIFVATGSGGTQAGLTAAMRLLDLPIRVIGVRIVPFPATTGLSAAWLANRMLAGLGKLAPELQDLRLSAGDFEMLDGYLGDGYGAPTVEGARARELLADTHGIPLEDTYTAKTLAAMLDAARSREISGPLLFWNTYNSAPPPPLPPASALPDEYQRFFGV